MQEGRLILLFLSPSEINRFLSGDQRPAVRRRESGAKFCFKGLLSEFREHLSCRYVSTATKTSLSTSYLSLQLIILSLTTPCKRGNVGNVNQWFLIEISQIPICASLSSMNRVIVTWRYTTKASIIITASIGSSVLSLFIHASCERWECCQVFPLDAP